MKIGEFYGTFSNPHPVTEISPISSSDLNGTGFGSKSRRTGGECSPLTKMSF